MCLKTLFQDYGKMSFWIKGKLADTLTRVTYVLYVT